MSNKWKKVEDEGQIFYVNEELGNIFQVTEDNFVAMIPKIVKLGPFETLEQAQQAMESNTLDQLIENYNLQNTLLCKAVKAQ